jgi:exopolyphosphatase/guanosine-5'-triphosphate,3'-diphosphate pyrophosphatase
MAQSSPRFGITGEELFDWIAPLFPGEDSRRHRLRMASSLLSDTAWNEHPDYRAQEAFMRGLRMPFAGIDHGERVFVATALHARYGGAADDPIKDATRRLLGEADHATARAIGLVLRLGYVLSGGAPGVLPRTRLELRDNEVALHAPAEDPLWSGETVQRRLDAVGRAFDRRGVIRLDGKKARG